MDPHSPCLIHFDDESRRVWRVLFRCLSSYTVLRPLRKAVIAALVMPGSVLKWQCDQLCVESQRFLPRPLCQRTGVYGC